MYTQRGDQVASPRQEPLDETKIFSAPELRNGVRLIQAAYECFGLNDLEFAMLARLISAFSRYCEQDYFIKIEVCKFRSILGAQTVFAPDDLDRLLINRASDFAKPSNNFEPFIQTGGFLITIFNLPPPFLQPFKKNTMGN